MIEQEENNKVLYEGVAYVSSTLDVLDLNAQLTDEEKTRLAMSFLEDISNQYGLVGSNEESN